MANGYVHPFMRGPHAFFPQPPPHLRRFPPANHYSSPNPRRAVDPAVLFASTQTRAQQEQPQCLFPNAFPEHGPNVFQRFWIRLFTFLFKPVVWLWRYARDLRDTLAVADWGALISDMDVDTLTLFLVENRWSIIIGLVVVVTLCVLAWFFSPKGENNTIWRSTLILTCASCYIMWAITFLAQWHPLIQPKVTMLRPGMPGMS